MQKMILMCAALSVAWPSYAQERQGGGRGEPSVIFSPTPRVSVESETVKGAPYAADTKSISRCFERRTLPSENDGPAMRSR